MPEPGLQQKKPVVTGISDPDAIESVSEVETDVPVEPDKAAPRELGGPVGPEPTRYGDWERKGRCIDF